MKNLQDIRTDLSFMKDHEVVVFGSYASKRADKRSDIDIAVITREKDRNRCMEIWKEILGKAPATYDIKIFELLPLHIKASLIQNYEVVFGNRLDISEYFYNFRKLWNDMKYRFKENQFQSTKEKIMALERYRRSPRRYRV
ncbi:nucleotidyltransferase family protein [Candidatus Methanoperedens nitroreducens]|uniref:Nucleotidyltransferase family protein n=1 Tax=Candidatus Methanoperedens nitratireducens TaxID=1392998 RepID=A0A062V7R3_9EURY|nr:nucleotidyltransferase domain-containing protein [Candidatus Methanoperedens nitroreducens]KCZ71809.1 nucleotidyltransferase family protein [Candidatus Methanoperedens nitroreducens]MDJ1422216.1 nucleotidyltransferase domain-containing protein [Candidatus Methanoperedens sp.]